MRCNVEAELHALCLSLYFCNTAATDYTLNKTTKPDLTLGHKVPPGDLCEVP